MNRRVLIVTATAAATALVTGPNGAQSNDIRGTVTFKAGAAIPAGRIELSLEEVTPDKTRQRTAQSQITSDGASREIVFSLTGPTDPMAARIVARLERPDGWLIARGSAPFEPDKTVEVTLNPVTY